MEFAYGFASGAATTEVAKRILAAAAKRFEDKSNTQRQLTIADVKALSDMVMPIFDLSISYYGAPSADGVGSALKIRRSLKTFAMQWDAVNAQLEKLGKTRAADHYLISFRKSISLKLDENRLHGLPLDTGLVQDMHRSATKLMGELLGLKYALA